MGGQTTQDSFPSRPRMIFLGTPQFAVPTLKALIQEGCDIISVVTQPDRPQGRGQRLTPSPVKILAEENNLSILQPKKLDEAYLNLLLPLKPELLVVVAFGQLIPGRVLSAATWGGINIHASLLPKYRGSAPIQWAIINNEKRTGLTTMCMDEGLDTGPILMQQEVDILEGETAGQLHDRLASLAPGLLIKTLQGWSNGTIEREEQDHSLATYAPKLTKEQGMINWSLPGDRVCGLIRGLDPWPGAFTYFNGNMLKLFGCLFADDRRRTSVPGRIKGLTGRGLEIETGKGSVIVRELQSPGKRRLPAGEFMRGSQVHPGSILGK
jgi:methionyl-tRNA formyltransferase